MKDIGHFASYEKDRNGMFYLTMHSAHLSVSHGVEAAGFLSRYLIGPIGGTAANQAIARSEFEVHRQIYTE